MNWNAPEIRALIRSALLEDNARRDVTTQLLIDPAWRIEAIIVANQNGVVAGLPLAERFLKALDPAIRFKSNTFDGARVRPKQRLATIKGKARAILSAERPALNALQHLSGIATFTHAMAAKLKGTKTRLYDTRKTLPGWRTLEKYAVQCGGGTNHRISLADAILVKDNHLKICRLAKSDWTARAERVKRQRPHLPFEVEVQTEQDLREVLRLKPQFILLDNLPIKKLREMMAKARRQIPGVQIEISGGVQPEELRALGKLGVERISMGRLTHSAPAFDCSLDITHVYPR